MTFRSLLFGTGDTSRPVDVGLLILRLGFGLALAFGHGLGKLPPSQGFIDTTAGLGFPLPTLFAWAAGLSEFLGGLLLALGLLTRPAGLFVAITLGVAAFVQHAGDPFGDRELALAYFVIGLAFAVMGAGRYALDSAIRDRNPSYRYT